MQNMTPAEIRSFLLDRIRTGKLATVRKDGRPHVVPVWFELDGDTIVFTTWHQTVKAANIRRDLRVCLCIDDETPPFDFVQIEGTAELINDPTALAYWATKIAGRYMGIELAEKYGKRNSVEGELIVRVTPTHTLAQKAIAD